MAKHNQSESWMNRLRSRDSRPGTDWGDLGTAFGLEMTLAPASEPTTAASSHAPGGPSRRWWQRLRTGA